LPVVATANFQICRALVNQGKKPAVRKTLTVATATASAPHRGLIDRMSRLRRPFLYGRYIFVTVDLLRSRGKLEERDYARLTTALARMRGKQPFATTALPWEIYAAW